MKVCFYPRLALDGMRRNKRLFVPYILTGAVMMMMYYILEFLRKSPLLDRMKGGGTLRMLLPFGCGVIGVFSLIFLFYTNSFLTRQRNREFGLYNILGMDKRNISRVMFWENLIAYTASSVCGILLGVMLSKLAELCMLNIMNTAADYSMRIEWSGIAQTLLVFGVIYFLLLLNSWIKAARSEPLELLHSDRKGEKPPKANWVAAVLGVLILAAAYYIAVSIKEPLVAMIWFFIAVIMVIIATYLLFVSGSVSLCRLLQKNKKYYYKPNHFVSVSSMIYRMKRNGAGLASICILCTMVLVMLSSTASLYIGAEDSLLQRYPRDISLEIRIPDNEHYNDESISVMRASVQNKVGEHKNVEEFRYAEAGGMFTDSGIILDQNAVDDFSISDYASVGYLLIVSLDEYNRITGESKTLESGECLLYSTRKELRSKTFSIENGEPLRIREALDGMFDIGYYSAVILPYAVLVTPEFGAVTESLQSLRDERGDSRLNLYWSYSFDLDADADAKIAVYQKLRSEMDDIAISEYDGGYSYRLECREEEKADFYGTYGSLFFLGIMLSIVFLFAAVLIIYYKQISEGYEDQSRFDIMQKVGMTEKDIRRSINSQIVTVFFAPLLFAGLHLSFAFPMVWKLLQLFALRNMTLVIFVTVISFLIFGAFYAMIYKLTASAYFNIVRGARER